jgi:peptide/nickel transport system permease protein
MGKTVPSLLTHKQHLSAQAEQRAPEAGRAFRRSDGSGTVCEDFSVRAGRAAQVRPVARFFAGRILQALVVVWSAVTLTFIAVHAAPGDIVDNLLTDAERSNAELRARVIAEWGLDKPVVIQYLGYLAKVVRGDLGTSYVQERSVNEIFAEQFPYTIELTAAAMVVAVIVALIGSLLISATSHPIVRAIYEGGELTLLSTPPFWFGILLLSIFSFRLGWFPVAGATGIASLVLPALAIGIPEGGNLSQILRQGIDRALNQPFVLTARSRGLTPLQVKRHHLLRHASIPAVTVGTLMVGNLLGGAVITEQVFGRPGLGQIAVNAITQKDMPVILAIAFVSSLVFVVASTVIDVLYAVIDPRLRLFEGKREA